MDKRIMRIALATMAITAIVVPAVALSATAKKHGYATSQLVVPTTNAQASQYARDIDHDGRVDDHLGALLAALASQGLDLQGAVDTAIGSGQLVMLHSLQTPSLSNTKDASWQVLYAQPAPSPDFSGSGSFTVASSPHSAQLPAKIKNGHVKTALGTIPVRLTLGEGVFTLNLKKGRLTATCSKSSCTSGVITGAVTEQQVDGTLIPQMATQFSAIVARDCPGPGPNSCADGSQGRTLEGLFDTNADLVITADELRGNSLISALLAPDLDLVKANGKPGQDGTNDALSAGFGFTAVSAHLVRP